MILLLGSSSCLRLPLFNLLPFLSFLCPSSLLTSVLEQSELLWLGRGIVSGSSFCFVADVTDTVAVCSCGGGDTPACVFLVVSALATAGGWWWWRWCWSLY